MRQRSRAETIVARDLGARRLRQATLAAGALAAAGTGVLAAVAASTTHRHAAASPVTTPRVPRNTVPNVPAPAATVQSGYTAPAAPQSAPSPSYAQPVAVSGGS